MALVKWQNRNRGDLARLHQEMDELFNSFFSGWNRMLGERGVWPALDIAEDDDVIKVKAEVPGCKADDIEVSVHGNTLTISGEKKQEEEKKGDGYYYAERSYGNFRRDVTLPTDVDPAKVEATCKDGVLNITLPKAEVAKATKVKVKG